MFSRITFDASLFIPHSSFIIHHSSFITYHSSLHKSGQVRHNLKGREAEPDNYI